MTAFADMLGVLFNDPHLSLPAVWKTGGFGVGVTVRVVRKQPDQLVNFGSSRAVVPTTLLDVRKSDVQRPEEGDTAMVDGTTYEIIGTPTMDTLRLVWTCEASAQC